MKQTQRGERDKCLKVLNKIKAWFEEDGFVADLPTLESKIKELTTIFNSIFNRIDKIKRYIKAKEIYIVEMDKAFKNAKNLIVTKPWTRDYYKANFTRLYETTVKWYTETNKKQDSLLANEVISFII